jgi:hypothetical protein
MVQIRIIVCFLIAYIKYSLKIFCHSVVMEIFKPLLIVMSELEMIGKLREKLT